MSAPHPVFTRVGRVLNRTVGSWLPAAFTDFWAEELGLLARRGQVMARVVSRRQETPDTVTLTLQAGPGFDGIRAGQHLNLTVDVAGIRHTRSYSVSNAPVPGGTFDVTVKRMPGGRVSTQIVDHVSEGTVLEIGPAFGDLSWPADDAPVLLLAAGSGVTPMMSLLRDRLSRDPAGLNVDFIYWARDPDGLIFHDELTQLALTHSGLRYVPIVEQGAAPDALSGRPSADQLAQAVPDLSQRQAYACGPQGFMGVLETLVKPVTVSFHAESFSPPTFVPAAQDAAPVTLTLTRSQRTVVVPAGMPLLDALEAQGVKPRSGCRMGICNTCACGASEGATQNLINQNVSTDATTSLRICVSAALTDLTLDL